MLCLPTRPKTLHTTNLLDQLPPVVLYLRVRGEAGPQRARARLQLVRVLQHAHLDVAQRLAPQRRLARLSHLAHLERLSRPTRLSALAQWGLGLCAVRKIT